MHPGEAPHFVSEFKPFQKSTLICLEDQPVGAFSGVSRDGHACWIVKGPVLEVLDAQTRNRLATWHFGRVLGDQHTSVTCVREFCVGESLKLLVGVSNSSPTGLVCLFDVALSKVVKAVDIPHQVTEVEVVSTRLGDDVPRWALSEQLRYFCGLVAVGTCTGQVYLLDMCIDDKEFFTDEELPSKVHFVWPRNRDIENQRFHCMSQGLHLGMALNESMFTQNGFEYQKPGGLVMKTFSSNQVSVTCLKYIPQAGLLAIGYNFGCYQLWKLHIPVLEYSSRLESDPQPVCHLAYQEPENDPKNFCYLWVARGPLGWDEENDVDPVSTITMYQLAFNNKAFYSSYGVFYDDLSSVCLRLDYELTSTPVQVGSNYEGSSRVVACYTLEDPLYQPPSRLGDEESFEENCSGPDLSLCVFVWEASEGQLSDKQGRHLALFDINRWYHAQMPSTVRYVSSSLDTCSYLCFCRLDEATRKADGENLLTAYVKEERLRKFVSTAIMPPEQHFYPASLAFGVKLVFESGMMETRFLGAQRQVLASLEQKGAQALVQPTDTYNLCIYTGLLPRSPDAAFTTQQQREALLSLTLDFNMVHFIKKCVNALAGGEYEFQGCGLKMLLDWSWDKVSTTKHCIDSTCTNLYNWSGLTLDQRAVQTLLQCSQKLKHLESVFKTFLNQAGPITTQGESELQSKILVTGLIRLHLDAVLWFHEVGLLPETDDTETSLGGLYCYPVTSLILAYKNRRKDLQNIHSDIGERDLLMIDGIVDHLGVQELWEREGGSGLYPPPSLYALLSTYLLETVDMVLKHCLVLYLLLDLVSVDSAGEEDQTFTERVSKFASRFSLPPTLIKIVQAFWLLDHKDFEEALSLLLNPLVTVEFSRWQHVRILRSLLYQGDSRMALRYLNSVRPALTTPEEVKLKLTILLANGLTAEALEYQRKCRDQSNTQDLLTHLFLGCQQTKTVDRLLQLPLTGEEEEALVSYLTESSEPHSQELLVMHYLQRARIIEAIQLNEKLKHSVMGETNAKARERASARNAMVESYAANLPRVQRKLLFEQVHIPKKNSQWRRHVTRPTPLSTKITRNKASVMSQSAFIMSIMEKLDELQEEDEDRTGIQNKSVGPFIGTPVTPARVSQKHTPATAYPESADFDRSRSGFTLQKSLTTFQTSGTPTLTSRRESKFYSASCMSLLQTPTVKKVTPKKQRMSNTNVITPQSILKVRHMISTTSPSPHSSGNTTPNSQELESSARKHPRKLGYGSSQPGTPRSVSVSDHPLSSLPRHLLAEKQTSQPSTPKSVSFVEPASPCDSSGPTTPQTGHRSFMPSASMIKPLSTPQHLRFSQSRSGPSTPVTPGSSRSVKDRSPTPESPEKSPRFAQNTDQLLRRPLRTTPDKTESEELELRLSDSDDHISDDNVEEMETSVHSMASSPGAVNASFASTSTVKHRDDLQMTLSPEALSPSPASPEQQSPGSPKSSPTVRISQSSTSEFASVTAKTPEANVTSSVEPEAAVEAAVEDEDVMETEETVSSSQPEDEQQVHREIFDNDEEIDQPGEIEEMEAEVVDVQQVDKQEGEGSPLDGSIKQELVEEELVLPPKPVRHLATPTQEVQGPSMLRRKSLTPPSERNIPLIKPKESPPMVTQAASEAAESPSVSMQPDLSIVKKSSPKDEDHLLQMINEQFADSPPETKAVNVAKSEAGVAETRTRRLYSIVPTNLDAVETTPKREPRQSSAEVSGSEDVPVLSKRSSRRQTNVESDTSEPSTPTRTSRRLSKVAVPSQSQLKYAENLVEISAISPRKFTEDAKQAVQESLLQISEDIKSKDEESPKVLAQGKQKAKSPSRTPTRSRKVVQESTPPVQEPAGSVELLIEEQVVASPGRSTRSGRLSLASPARVVNKKVTTPRRGRKKDDENVSPLRDSNTNNMSPLQSSFSPTALNADIAASVRRNTPTRSRRKKLEHVADELESIPETAAVTPTRKSRHQKKEAENIEEFGYSDIPIDVEDNESEIGTPSRRQSLSRSCKTVAQIAQEINSPSRRKSLQVGDVEVPRTPTRQGKAKAEDIDEENIDNNIPRTPSRRGKSKEEGSTEENKEEVLKTPRRGRNKVGEGEAEEKLDASLASVKRTPSRRGKKTEEAEVKPETPSRRGKKKDEAEDEVKPETPSRRGRAKKAEEVDSILQESLPHTPSRRGRPKKVDALEEPAADVSEAEMKPETPSRSGRGRKAAEPSGKAEDVVAEIEQPATPSRRGKGKSRTPTRSTKSKGDEEVPDDKVGSDSDSKATGATEAISEGEEQKVSTPSRRRQAKKAETPEVEAGKDTAHTPSRSKRAKTDKESIAASRQPDVFDIQANKFQFSDPTQLDVGADGVEEQKAFTPVASFIFSPPLQRTRSTTPSESTPQPEGFLLPPGPSVSQPVEQKKGKKTKGRTKKLYKEDTILQLTPTSPNISDSGEDGRDIITRTTRTTRRTVTTKKDGTKLLVQSIAAGRTHRTKYRFGPVGSKK